MMVYCLTIERNEVVIHTTEMNLKIIALSGRSETKKKKKGKYCVILYIKFRKCKAYL